MSRRAGPAARATLLAGAVLVSGLLSSCGGYAAASHRGGYPTGPAAGYGASHPSAAEQATALAATEGYRRYLLTSAERLTDELARIARTASRGDLSGARGAEQAAQGDFDMLRADIAPDSATAIQLDGESWSDGASPFTGLHVVERDLWAAQDLRAAARVAEGLAALALQTGYVFSRAVLTPAQMLAQAQAQLEWAVDVPLEGREELYSHLDLADVVASVVAARTALSLSAPLGRLVAPAAVRTCTRRFAVLGAALRSLGSPASRTDATIPLSAWRSVAGALDAADGAVGVLQGKVQGFGSGRLYA
jgi:hypothetical protein